MPEKKVEDRAWFKTGKLDKVVQALARGLSKRQIQNKFRADRNTTAEFFNSRLRISYSAAKRIVEHIVKTHMTYTLVVKKFGRQGLQALNDWHELCKQEKRKKFLTQVKALRGNLATPTQSLTKVGLALGVSREAVRDILQRSSKLARGANVAMQTGAKVRTRVCILRHRGCTVPQIAAAIQRSPVHVRCILREAGMPLSKERLLYALTEQDWHVIHALVLKGTCWSTVARIYKKTRKYVSEFYHNNYPKYAFKTEEKAVVTNGKR